MFRKEAKTLTSLIALRSMVVLNAEKSLPECCPVEGAPPVADIRAEPEGEDCDGEKKRASMCWRAILVFIVPSSASASRMPISPNSASSSLWSCLLLGIETEAGAAAGFVGAGAGESA